MSLPSELRSAARALASRPSLAAAIATSLALSIWMATSVFSVAYGVLARPLPYPDAERIVSLENTVAMAPPGSQGAFAIPRIVRESNVLVERAMYVPGASANLAGADRPERVVALPVSDRFFAVFGVQPLLGRAMSGPNDIATTVLSYGLWQRAFGGDSGVVGRVVQFNGRPYTVLGVLPPTFAFPERTDAWISLPEPPDFYVNAIAPEYVGRLAPGLALEQAQNVLRAQEAEAYRARGREVDHPITLVSLRDQLTGGIRGLLHLLVGAVSLVILLGALNAAMLLVAHVGRRRLEFGIRQALGATKGILYRQLVLECLLLAMLGTAVGLVLALWSDGVLRTLLPATMPRAAELGIDRATVLFAATIGVLVGVATGLVAGIRAARFDVARLHDSATKAPGSVDGRRLLRALVLSEMAVAFVLATGTGLLTRSLLGASQVDLGFRPEAVTTFRLQLPELAYPPQQRVPFVDRLLSGLRAIPGVTAVGLTNDLPLATQLGAGWRLRPVGNPDGVDTVGVGVNIVSGDYFQAMGVPLIVGRTFTQADASGSLPVIIVSESAARRLAPAGSALGLHVQGGSQAMQIVGIVGDIRERGPDQPIAPAAYVPYGQLPITSVSIAVRASSSVAGSIHDVVRQLDPALPVFELRTMRDIVATALAERRFALMLVGVFSLFGLGLALFGVYAVAMVTVVERMREIGIRVALGASRLEVLRLVLREGLFTGVAGIVVGMLGAMALRPAVASLLFGVQPHDSLTLIVVAVVMVGIALLGAARPALRASRVDPVVTLRSE